VTEWLKYKPAFIAALLALLWMLESLAPMFLGRQSRFKHGVRNILLGLINGIIGYGVVRWGLYPLTVLTADLHFGLLQVVALPEWAQWVVALVLLDAWMYVWHIANHYVPLLWRFHEVHHTDTEVDASSALRFHFGEVLFAFAGRAVVLVLLGMSLEMMLFYELFLLPVVYLHHSNVRIPGWLDQLLRTVVVTPQMHWVHHSQRWAEANSDFGNVLSVWDRLFRTLRLRKRPRDLNLGLPGRRRQRRYSLAGMLAQPFREQKNGNNEWHF